MAQPLGVKYKVRSYEADFNNMLKLSSVFNYMQETASMHAEQLNLGFEHLKEKGLYWVLSRTKIIMETYPKSGEEIIVETWPKGINKLFALRDFKFYNSHHYNIGKATTAWLMIDKKTTRPIRPDGLLENIPEFEADPAIKTDLEKLPATDDLKLVHEIKIGYMDIDINQHVNNVKYIEYVLNSLPEEFFNDYRIDSMQVNFLSQLKFGERIKIFERDPRKSNDLYVEGIGPNNVKVFQSVCSYSSESKQTL